MHYPCRGADVVHGCEIGLDQGAELDAADFFVKDCGGCEAAVVVGMELLLLMSFFGFCEGLEM